MKKNSFSISSVLTMPLLGLFMMAEIQCDGLRGSSFMAAAILVLYFELIKFEK